MNQKRFLLIFLSFAAIFIALRSGFQEEEEKKNFPLLSQEYQEKIPKLTRVSFEGEGKNFSFYRKNQQWLLEQKDNYPADAQKIHSWLMTLMNSKVLELKTKNPYWHEKLGLFPLNTGGKKVQLQQGEETAFSLFIGNPSGLNGLGTYVRLADDNQALLVSGDLLFSSAEIDWLNREILKIAEQDIHSIIVNNAQEPFTLSQENPGDVIFKFDGLPEGKILKDDTSHLFLVFSFQELLLSDVKPRLEEKSLAHPIEINLFDGCKVHMTLYKSENKFWITLGASYDVDLAEKFNQQDKIKENLQKVEDWNQKWQGWYYQISEEKGSIFAKTLGHYVQ